MTERPIRTRLLRHRGMWVVPAALIVLAGAVLTSRRHPTEPAVATSEGRVAAPAPAATTAPAETSTGRRCPDEERLARAFAPALALAPGDQAPRPVEILLDRAQLVYRDGDRIAEASRVDAARLAALRGQPEAFLQLPPALDDRQEYRRLYEEAVTADRTGRYAVTAYARVHCAATTAGLGGRTVLQYWLFYLYNDFQNTHEGDWELVQVVLDGAHRPLYAAYAQHNTYSWRLWDEVLIDRRDTDGDGIPEEHPRVYVARGSHASYFQYAPNGYGDDRVADSAEFVIPSIRLLPGPDDEEPGFAWLRFAGRWGEVPAGTTACRGCGPGPAGPVYNSNGAKWKSPLEWGGQRLTRDDLIANRTARVTVDGAGRTHVYDSLSRHTGPLVTGALETAIPGSVHLTRPGTRRAIVLLPGFTDRTAGRVEIEGGEIRSLRVLLPSEFGSAEHQFPRVVLGPTGVARMDLGSDAPALRIDADGDGSFERQVLPLAPQIPPP